MSNKRALAEAIAPMTAMLLFPSNGADQSTCVRLKIHIPKARIIKSGSAIFISQKYRIISVDRY